MQTKPEGTPINQRIDPVTFAALEQKKIMQDEADSQQSVSQAKGDNKVQGQKLTQQSS
jgi:hypothetical protein